MFETTRDKTLEVIGGTSLYDTLINNDDEITICISIHLEFTQSLVVITRVE
jgi:hypothetical protein